MDAETIVLGGGISGLATARYLEGDRLVLEAEDRPGGLCRTLERDGFVYDIGGHILFSKNQSILAEMVSWLGENVHTRVRKNRIWYRDRFVKYPFENGLAALEKEEVFEILMSFLNRTEGTPTNLEEWCRFRFGEGLAQKYLIPYNRKIWKCDPKMMGTHWVERIPSPPTEDIVKSAIGIETEGYTFQLNFQYPKEGGIESMIRGLADRVPAVETGFRVRSVRKNGDEWEVSDGSRTLRCNRLISTMPVFDLLASLEGVPDAVTKAVEALRYTSLVTVMVGVNHEGLSDGTGLYIPDPDILPHRICYPRYVSAANAPDGCSHLFAEITTPPGDPVLDTDDDVLVERVVGDLEGICGFTKSEVIASAVDRFEYAYPVYDLDYLANTRTLYDYMDAQGIHFTGRFAAFRYVNMDVCVEMAKDLAEALNAGQQPTRAWSHM